MHPSARRFFGMAACLWVVTAGDLQAQTDLGKSPENSRQLLSLIDSFLTHPFNEDLRTALFDSAEARPDVSLSLSASVTPMLCYEENVVAIRAMDALLVTAYVAGNMREQLLTGKKGDQPYAGVVAVLNVYDILRDKVRNYSVPELDHWREVQAAGRLHAFADSLAQHPAPDCERKPPRYGNGRLVPID